MQISFMYNNKGQIEKIESRIMGITKTRINFKFTMSDIVIKGRNNLCTFKKSIKIKGNKKIESDVISKDNKLSYKTNLSIYDEYDRIKESRTLTVGTDIKIDNCVKYQYNNENFIIKKHEGNINTETKFTIENKHICISKSDSNDMTIYLNKDGYPIRKVRYDSTELMTIEYNTIRNSTEIIVYDILNNKTYKYILTTSNNKLFGNSIFTNTFMYNKKRIESITMYNGNIELLLSLLSKNYIENEI